MDTNAQKKRILVVDPNEVGRDLLIQYLKFSGYDAYGARNGENARHILESNLMEMVFTELVLDDINPAERSGFELLLHIEKTHPGLPVVIMSGDNRYSGIVSSLKRENKALDFLLKPFNICQVENLVKKFLNAETTAE
jgi:DNA-binding NtrC family response regulator